MKKKVLNILVILVFIYIIGQIVGSLAFTNPILFIICIGIGFLITVFGLIRLPFNIVKHIKTLKRR